MGVGSRAAQSAPQMKIDTTLIVMWSAVAALILITWRRQGSAGVRAGFFGSWHLTKMVIQIVPLALLGAALFTQLIPERWIVGLIGPDSGFAGIVIASLAGGLVPSGPFVSFPIALSLIQTGAGPAQIVAFLTGWSVYAFYRVMVWEIPTMGVQFTLHRMVASLLLPIVAGLLAAAMFQRL
jgi:uncharacterized membrane protein YraQ (UPF0718 family)